MCRSSPARSRITFGFPAADTAHKVADAAGSTVDRIASSAQEAVDKTADVVAQAAETLGVKGEQLKELQ